MTTGVYGTNLSRPWVTLCCLPAVGGIASFIGMTIEGIRAEELVSSQKTHRRAQSEAGKGGEDATGEEQLMERASGIVRRQAVYAMTGTASAALSLGVALLVQSAVTPIFQICALWTAAYGLMAYWAVGQVKKLEDEGVPPHAASLFAKMLRVLYLNSPFCYSA